VNEQTLKPGKNTTHKYMTTIFPGSMKHGHYEACLALSCKARRQESKRRMKRLESKKEMKKGNEKKQ